MTEKELQHYLLPVRLRGKDGYWHMLIESKHPITKEIIRHSKSTKIRIIGKNQTETKNNKIKAEVKLLEFQKKWSDFHFKNIQEVSNNILFTDYLKSWLSQIKPFVKPYTYRNYKYIIEKKVIPKFEKKKLLLTEVKARHLQEFYTYCLEEKELNPNTVIRYHANIRKALQTALKQELVLSNQADLVDKPRRERYIARVLPISDLLKILEKIEENEEDLTLPTFFSVYYGLRRGEAAGLLWSNIDFKNKKIVIGNALVEDENRKLFNRKELKTKSSYRTLELLPDVEKFLLEIKEKQEQNKKIFGNTYNYKYIDNICVKKNGDIIKLGYITQKFKKVVQKLGYEDIHFHCLRHSFATNMYDEGMDMKELQVWLGHSSISTTMDIYLHFLERRMKESSKILENAMRKGEEKIIEEEKK